MNVSIIDSSISRDANPSTIGSSFLGIATISGVINTLLILPFAWYASNTAAEGRLVDADAATWLAVWDGNAYHPDDIRALRDAGAFVCRGQGGEGDDKKLGLHGCL